MSSAHEILWIWAYTMAAFWAGTVIIFVRRGRAPTRAEVQFVKFGFFPLFILACYIVGLVWKARGR
jgi:hypothetical protein